MRPDRGSPTQTERPKRTGSGPSVGAGLWPRIGEADILRRTIHGRPCSWNRRDTGWQGFIRGLLSSKTKAAANPRDRYGFVVMYRLSLTKNLPGASWTPVKQWTREIRHGLHAETLPKLVRKRTDKLHACH